jgi:hypothetical protein
LYLFSPLKKSDFNILLEWNLPIFLVHRKRSIIKYGRG